MDIGEEECLAAGKDAAVILRLARKLENISKEMKTAGVYLFGGSGTGTIRFNDGRGGPLVLAHVGQGFDGGDGAARIGSDGLLRGE